MPSCVGDDQLHSGEAAALEPAQEVNPEGLGLRGADGHAQHLTPTVGVDRDGEGHRDRDDAPGLAHLHVGGVDPEIGPVALDRALEEGADALVDLLAQAADLALGDAGHAQRLDQLVDRAGRDALHVGPPGSPPRAPSPRPGAAPGSPGSSCLFSAWGCAAPPCRHGSPSPGRGSRCAAPAGSASARHTRPGQPLHLELHQPPSGKADHLAQKISVGGLLEQLAKGDPVVGHRGDLRSAVAGRNPTLPEIP